MAIKPFGIKFILNDSMAVNAAKRQLASFAALDKAALKTANAYEHAYASMTKGAQSLTATAVNGFNAQFASGVKLANGTTAIYDRMTKSAVNNSKQRLKIARTEAVQIDVGLFKVAVNGIKYQDDLTRAAEKASRDRERMFDRAQKKEHDADVKAAKERQKLFDKAVSDEHDREIKAIKEKEAEEAKAAAKADQRAKKNNSDALGAYGRLANVRRKMLSEEQLQDAARNKMLDATHNKRIKQILEEQYSMKDNFTQSLSDAIGLERAISGVGLAMTGLSVGKSLVNGIADAFLDAKKNASDFGKMTLEVEKSLRPLASIMGKKPDTKFATDIANFGVNTGLGVEGSNKFLESFLGRAQITRDKQISGDELDKFAVKAGQLAQAKGIPEDVAGDLFGSVLKVENFKAKGQGSPEALARAAVALKILDAGSGKMPQLGPELNKAMAELTSEDKLAGVFRNVGESAVAISVAAEHNPAEAGTLVARTSMGLRDFENDDKKAFFKRTGITDKDSFLEAVAKANKAIGEEVAGGVPVDTAIKEFGFKEIRETRGLKTFFNAKDTVLAPQLANLAASDGPGGVADAEAQLKDLRREQVVRDAVAQANVEKSKFMQGTKAAEFEIAKKEAEAQLVKEGMDTTVFGGFKKELARAETFWKRDGRDVLIEDRAAENLRKQAGAKAPGALDRVGSFAALSIGSPVVALASMWREGGLRSPQEMVFGADREEMSKLQERTNTLLEQQNKLLEQQNKLMGPAPVVNAPQPMPVNVGAARPIRP